MSVAPARDLAKYEVEYSRALNRLGETANDLRKRSYGFQAMNHDPRVTAIWLLARLRDHIQAFALLVNGGLIRDAESVQRSAIEAAICLETLRRRPEEFQELLRRDAVSTLEGQIPVWRSVDPDLADQAVEQKAGVFGPSPDGKRDRRLSFVELAKDASLEHLYRWHKHLSGHSVHVTGLSLVFDGASLFGLADVKAERRRDAIAHLVVTAAVGLSAFASIHGHEDLKVAVDQIMAALGRDLEEDAA